MEEGRRRAWVDEMMYGVCAQIVKNARVRCTGLPLGAEAPWEVLCRRKRASLCVQRKVGGDWKRVTAAEGLLW